MEEKKVLLKHICTAPSTGGSNYNIGQIAADEFQFGVAQSDWQFHAVNGSSKWEGKQFKGLRAVFSVHNEPFQIWARKKARIKDFADLEGKVVTLVTLVLVREGLWKN